MNVYATVAAAKAQASRISASDAAGDVPVWLLFHVLAVVRDPRSGSDMLLITADALRSDMDDIPEGHLRRAALRLADDIAALAPTRANPVA